MTDSPVTASKVIAVPYLGVYDIRQEQNGYNRSNTKTNTSTFSSQSNCRILRNCNENNMALTRQQSTNDQEINVAVNNGLTQESFIHV